MLKFKLFIYIDWLTLSRLKRDYKYDIFLFFIVLHIFRLVRIVYY